MVAVLVALVTTQRAISEGVGAAFTAMTESEGSGDQPGAAAAPAPRERTIGVVIRDVRIAVAVARLTVYRAVDTSLPDPPDAPE